MEGEPRTATQCLKAEKDFMRSVEARINDILTNALALNFKIIVGHPIHRIDGRHVIRIPPPMVPGEKPQLTFYVSEKAWELFVATYHVEKVETEKHAIQSLIGAVVEFYKPPEESADGGASGGIGGLSADR